MDGGINTVAYSSPADIILAVYLGIMRVIKDREYFQDNMERIWRLLNWVDLHMEISHGDDRKCKGATAITFVLGECAPFPSDLAKALKGSAVFHLSPGKMQRFGSKTAAL